MNPFILSIETATPGLARPQQEVMQKVLSALPETDPQRGAVQRIYRGSRIETRHSVVADYANDTLSGTFFGPDYPSTAPAVTKSTRKRPPHWPMLQRKRHWKPGAERGNTSHTLFRFPARG